jgi:superfamily II DNA helicase RecQ
MHPDDDKPVVTLVVSPLKALMIDQEMRWTQMGIPARAIRRRDEMSDEEINGILYLNFNYVICCLLTESFNSNHDSKLKSAHFMTITSYK